MIIRRFYFTPLQIPGVTNNAPLLRGTRGYIVTAYSSNSVATSVEVELTNCTGLHRVVTEDGQEVGAGYFEVGREYLLIWDPDKEWFTVRPTFERLQRLTGRVVRLTNHPTQIFTRLRLHRTALAWTKYPGMAVAETERAHTNVSESLRPEYRPTRLALYQRGTYIFKLEPRYGGGGWETCPPLFYLDQNNDEQPFTTGVWRDLFGDSQVVNSGTWEIYAKLAFPTGAVEQSVWGVWDITIAYRDETQLPGVLLPKGTHHQLIRWFGGMFTRNAPAGFGVVNPGTMPLQFADSLGKWGGPGIVSWAREPGGAVVHEIEFLTGPGTLNFATPFDYGIYDWAFTYMHHQDVVQDDRPWTGYDLGPGHNLMRVTLLSGTGLVTLTRMGAPFQFGQWVGADNIVIMLNSVLPSVESLLRIDITYNLDEPGSIDLAHLRPDLLHMRSRLVRMITEVAPADAPPPDLTPPETLPTQDLIPWPQNDPDV